MRDLYQASSHEASYDSGDNYDRPTCHPKTRMEYLSALEDWSREENPSCPRLLWMHGPAGTGKSAIAQSFCTDHKSHLGGSFFFKRGHPSRGNAIRVFPTLAYHLAIASPELQIAITSTIREDPGVLSKSLAIQLQKLIVAPCQAVNLAFPLTIVIDGLDEGEIEESQQSLLAALGDAYNDWKSHLAILITSRPEAHLQSVFEESCSRFTQMLEIQGSEVVMSRFDDIRTYLVDQFQRIREKHPSLHSTPILWPGDEVVEQFVEKSSGHFVYASTVVKFIDDQDWNPQERLEVVQGIEREHPSASPFFTLDQLYTGILAQVPNQPRLLLILPVIAANLQLSVLQMGQLLELQPTDIQTMLRRLPSLINVPAIARAEEGTNDRITVHHASFLDFLNDRARAGQFHFNGTARHRLALHILKVYSEPAEIGLWPASGHVWGRLKLNFITTTYLSPDMVEALHQINFDLVVGEDGLSQVTQWIKDHNEPGDLTQQWEDYASMGKFQNIIGNFKLGEETDDMPEAMETISPTVVQIIQICTLLAYRDVSSLNIACCVLDYSWGEMQSIIAPISLWKDIDIQNLCSEISSPLRIQELNPDQVLQKLATRCIEMLCLQLQTPKKGWEPGIFWCQWGYIVRACFPTLELLETVQGLVTAENLEIMKNYQNDSHRRTNHIHNLVVWLEAHPNAPLQMVEQLKACYDTKQHREYENRWNRWKECTGLGGS
ncbi:hypothetical protein R3P38DRAFT_2651501 [Favolaschia claudopus]|uniref:Nephrocystin 3-like N-terminal domain-containing protein n=1 Tax=Favolaschia claudopus TaxID=2862362 RepID=A0AAW0A3B8_9AGAR